MIAAADAFTPTSVKPCLVTIEGVSGNLTITAIGTVVFVVIDDLGQEVLLEIHQSLQSNGVHNLLSVSHLLQLPEVSITLTNDSPMIDRLWNDKKRFQVLPLISRFNPNKP